MIWNRLLNTRSRKCNNDFIIFIRIIKVWNWFQSMPCSSLQLTFPYFFILLEKANNYLLLLLSYCPQYILPSWYCSSMNTGSSRIRKSILTRLLFCSESTSISSHAESLSCYLKKPTFWSKNSTLIISSFSISLSILLYSITPLTLFSATPTYTCSIRNTRKPTVTSSNGKSRQIWKKYVQFVSKRSRSGKNLPRSNACIAFILLA
jgi:hypothetical protein